MSFEDEVESAWSDLFLSSTQLCLQLTVDNDFDQSNSAGYAEAELIRLKLSQVRQFDLNPWSDREGVPDPSTAEPVDDELIRKTFFKLSRKGRARRRILCIITCLMQYVACSTYLQKC